MSRGDRIGIVGAGIAGLTVARALRAAGRARVTVFEREPHVGGKCCTVRVGDREYELGAAIISPLYTNVRRLMRATRTPWAPVASIAYATPDGAIQSHLLPPGMERRFVSFGAESARCFAEMLRDRALWRPGFAHLAESLHLPFETWAERHGYTDLAAIVRPWFTGFGYGYLEEMPAAYVLKYMTVWGFPFAQLPGGGVRALCERIAREHDVRTDTEVRRIVRGDDGVMLETSAGRVELDWLVLACPLDEVLSVLDASDEERALFRRIRTIDFRVVAATVSGLAPHPFTFCVPNMHRSGAGEPVFWYRRWADRPVWTFYVIEDGDPSLDETSRRVERAVRRLGGRLHEIHHARAWRYFPHADRDAMDEGFHARLEALQGVRRTFYAGELLSFPTLETVTSYSSDLVARRLAEAERVTSHPR
ncbi:FAD-dependent oxidoreductase [Sandaracinus amylolyticus]|uniref:FAD-dependent oxidoreductase n=1 Tax=Sandaracinus amylolyticus TaxID=927083 RepID=UPI001F17F34A|nr:FAD-dependent oxidoreductase [Sandaracinus amylolyticus]UJR78978.1 FAD-dependent oxidoreductase [Sandaracinus amylolyticus]